MNALKAYGRAQDRFDAVLAAVPAQAWDRPSECAQWTVRDVAGHVIGGQEQLRHWATGQAYGRTDGAPGAARPGILAGANPVETFHAWDIAHARQFDIRLDSDLVAGSLAWAHDNIVRVPGFFGPELSAPPDADEQTRWLAHLGRAAWQPVPA